MVGGPNLHKPDPNFQCHIRTDPPNTCKDIFASLIPIWSSVMAQVIDRRSNLETLIGRACISWVRVLRVSRSERYFFSL